MTLVRECVRDRRCEKIELSLEEAHERGILFCTGELIPSTIEELETLKEEFFQRNSRWYRDFATVSHGKVALWSGNRISYFWILANIPSSFTKRYAER